MFFAQKEGTCRACILERDERAFGLLVQLLLRRRRLVVAQRRVQARVEVAPSDAPHLAPVRPECGGRVRERTTFVEQEEMTYAANGGRARKRPQATKKASEPSAMVVGKLLNSDRVAW